MAAQIEWFDGADAGSHDLVGGKGANLGKLVAAGFPVPPGFTVTTAAYSEFMQGGGLFEAAEKLLSEADFGDAEQIAERTGQIRDRVVATEIPTGLADQVLAAYAKLDPGRELRVAVRSSGTAEDLADASFAGMHDTYLDISGPEALLDAVRRCWASLWTARATSYREKGEFDHLRAGLAVVVQEMVSSRVSGVMFTANPLTANTTEIVLNASWGLGEAIVSGIVTPDEYTLSRATGAVLRKTINEKRRQVVREDPSGTREEEIPADLRSEPSLSEREASRVATLGREVCEFYDGMPQDIEWALAGEELYLLQSRDVTGVDFTWDEDVDASFQVHPDQNGEVLWTNQWAREFWNGAITPLHYSVRARMFEYSHLLFRQQLGHPDVKALRLFKYRRGTVYFNTEADALHYTHLLPRALRAGGVGNVHPDDQPAVLEAPFDVRLFVRTMLRQRLLGRGHGPNAWLEVSYDFINDSRGPGSVPGYGHGPELFAENGGMRGFTKEQLQALSDKDLKRHTQARMDLGADFNAGLWDGFFITAPLSLGTIGWMLANWYDGADASTFQNLISGLPSRTKAADESHLLWELAQRIKGSEQLQSAFEDNPGGAFFEAAAELEDGREFLAAYAEFLVDFGPRGHADRDFYYDRRSDNPTLDYEAFRAILMSDQSRTPEEIEKAQVQQREETTEQVLAGIRRGPLGAAKAALFSATLDYAHRFLTLRDDERWAFDHVTMSKRDCFVEISERLRGRGVLEGEDDFFFLAKEELFALLDGRPATRLTRAKIAARKRVFLNALAREEPAPLYLRGDNPLAEEAVGADGVMQGAGTSKGEVTGTARVIRNLTEIGRVEKDDILICNSTDPGWASVFLIIKGLVIETGGILAHGACLSREYGLPAVTLANAIQHVPDGATITVNGDTGQVTLAAAEETAAPEAVPA